MDPYKNFAYGVVQAGSTIIGSAASPRTIVLGTGQGANFPGGDGSTPFNVVVWPERTQPISSNAEIVRCTRVGDTLTTTARAQESTSALTTIAAGYQVGANVTKKLVDDINTALAAIPVAPQRKTTVKDVVSSTTETDLLNGEITIPAGVLSTNKLLRVTLIGDYLNNSGATPTTTLRIKLGATTLYADDIPVSPNAGRRAFRIVAEIANLGAANAQWLVGLIAIGTAAGATTGLGDLGASAATAAGNLAAGNYQNVPIAGVAGAVDTSVAQALAVTAQHDTNNASISCRLKYAIVEVI